MTVDEALRICRLLSPGFRFRRAIGVVFACFFLGAVLTPPAHAAEWVRTRWHTRYHVEVSRAAACPVTLSVTIGDDTMRVDAESRELSVPPRGWRPMTVRYRWEDYLADVGGVERRLTSAANRELTRELLSLVVGAWGKGFVRAFTRDLVEKVASDALAAALGEREADPQTLRLMEQLACIQSTYWGTRFTAQDAADPAALATADVVSGVDVRRAPCDAAMSRTPCTQDQDVVLDRSTFGPGLAAWRGVAPVFTMTFAASAGTGAWEGGGGGSTGTQVGIALPWEALLQNEMGRGWKGPREHVAALRPYAVLTLADLAVGPADEAGRTAVDEGGAVDASSLSVHWGAAGLGGALRYQRGGGFYVQGAGGAHLFGPSADLVLHREEGEDVRFDAAVPLSGPRFAPYAELGLGTHLRAGKPRWSRPSPVWGLALGLDARAYRTPAFLSADDVVISGADGAVVALPDAGWSWQVGARLGFAL